MSKDRIEVYRNGKFNHTLYNCPVPFDKYKATMKNLYRDDIVLVVLFKDSQVNNSLDKTT